MNNVSFKRIATVELDGALIPFDERPFVVVEGQGPIVATEEMLLVGGATEQTTLKDPISMAVQLWRSAKDNSVFKEVNSNKLANELGLSLRSVMNEREVECLLAGLQGGTCS